MATVLRTARGAMLAWPANLIGTQIPVRLFDTAIVRPDREDIIGRCYMNGCTYTILRGEISPQVELTT
jgi:hypothetical protein